MSRAMQFPHFPEPIWQSNIQTPQFDALREHKTVDIAIIGAGITGITTAYFLLKAGFTVALIDAGKVMSGTTGHTTAKLTAQHDLIYDELIHHIGKDQAKLYYEANQEAIEYIAQLITEHGVDCGFSRERATLYATDPSSHQKLKKEFEAYEKLGIPGKLSNEIPFNINIESALVMDNQAQFHPLQYLLFLVNEIKNAGGSIYENTTAIDIQTDAKPVVVTREGWKITCDNVITSTHFPFFDGKGFYFTRMHAEKSYVLAIKPSKEYPGGMYLSTDQPKRSLRSATINGEQYVLVGGESHKTGQGINTMKHYEALYQWAESTIGIKNAAFRWSTQDLVTIDNIPYIGPISSNHDNIFVATGYRKWGMTTSVVAASILRDLITKTDNPYCKIFTPSRFIADPGVKDFIVQNADVAGHFIAGKVGLKEKRIEEMSSDEGAVVKVKGKRTGAYKDENGYIHLVDTTCTHLGCECEWNSGDRTWDCPCHGSRFSYDGSVIEGPANRPLKKVSPENNS
ncbi:FAD-dependent oxidoreductase [Pseudalkalibacillus berkeleyi]|uniref:FAD-dependent oxidoreductase n=1 Tax=Pseudalkalibacillus berkeleyi TaxID=1069813 RepID=A0ABS9H5R6_9BACL|nr:FAD-dependent oxidoreductase [Pseudalkalibacillus berkeleyi]MCF6139030.1 FAD-dependent oxidoreductase [Pseudalkalibacillus berkeleyi]